jgi:ubiquinol-cytochrome c reductase iron-sulfur subunit
MNRNPRESEGGVLAIFSFAWKILKFFTGLFMRLLPSKPAPPIPESGRSADLPTDIESPSQAHRRERLGSFFVVCSFLLAVAAGIGFLVTYWTGGPNELLGTTLALCLGGFGATLVLWSHWLMRHKQAVEPREVLPSSESERESTAEAFCAGEHDVRRRSLLKWMSAAAVGLFASIVVSLMRSLGVSPASTLFSTVWKRGQRLVTIDGTPISLDSLQPGSSITVFPENSIGSERAQTVLIRVHQQSLQLPEDRANWAPAGYVAYSRVCTHAGCPVGLFESERSILLCPCHQSTFDVLRAAAPTGGPAARPLPQLPLYADASGTLRAAGGFSEPPGPGFWGMP